MAHTLRKILRRATLACALALGGPLALLGAGPAAAQTAITGCTAITAPGTYILATDLTCPGDAITITADNVRLLLNGRTITGGGSGRGVRANGTTGNPTLTGLTIQGPGTATIFLDGVFVGDAPGARVAGVTATGNVRGVLVNASPGARVADNTAAGNDLGIFVIGCERCEVSGNRADDSEVDGILAIDTPRSRFAANTAAGNGDNGIHLSGCPGCEVAGNRAEGSGDEGLFIEGGTTGARIAGNTATGNGGEGIDLSTGTVDGNLVQGNTTNGNGASGIRVAAGATGNTLEGNRATGNAPDLTDENPTTAPCANTWRANRFAIDSEGDGPGAGCIR